MPAMAGSARYFTLPSAVVRYLPGMRSPSGDRRWRTWYCTPSGPFWVSRGSAATASPPVPEVPGGAARGVACRGRAVARRVRPPVGALLGLARFVRDGLDARLRGARDDRRVRLVQ